MDGWGVNYNKPRIACRIPGSWLVGKKRSATRRARHGVRATWNRCRRMIPPLKDSPEGMDYFPNGCPARRTGYAGWSEIGEDALRRHGPNYGIRLCEILELRGAHHPSSFITHGETAVRLGLPRNFPVFVTFQMSDVTAGTPHTL